MKKILILLLIGVVLSGCINNNISGKYYNENKPKDYIEIFDDGTFIKNVYDSGKNYSLSGTYRIDKDAIILKYEMFGTVDELQIIENGKILKDDKGERYIKK